MNSDNKSSFWKKNLTIVGSGIAATALGLGTLLFTRYKVSSANQYLIRTGLGLKDINIVKKGFDLYPLQKCQYVNLNPSNYSFELHNMSKEKVPFNLPVVFTIGPVDPNSDMDLFKNYARKMMNISKQELDSTIQGIIHGQTRILSATLDIESMFSDKDKFKNMVTDHIQLELNPFGLKVYNANIAEMKDLPGNEYFEYRKQKAIQSANNEARVEVAEAKKMGDIGENERQAFAKQRIATIDAETLLIQNTQQKIISESNKELNVVKETYTKEEQIAKIEAQQLSKIREIELQQEVERKRQDQKLIEQRADVLTKAQVNAEAQIKEAEGNRLAQILKAEADLITKEKEAMGMKLIFDAQSEGIRKLVESANGDFEFLKYKMGVESGLLENVAKHSADAIRDMKPKINIWNTGNQNNEDLLQNFAKSLTKTIPPILDLIQTQTNIKLPGVKSSA